MALERSIIARTRGGTAFAGALDFLVRRGRPVPLRQAFYDAPECLSPYCLDVDRQTVTFVRTESGVDLARVHPFFYEAQRRSACATLTASFDEVLALGDELASLRPRIAFLYSAGRSGSTVAGKIAGALPGVQSISEPDVYSLAALQRIPGDVARDAQLVRIVRATTRLLAAHRARVCPDRPTLLVKQRGVGVYAAPLFAAALPSSRALYLERSAPAVVDSYLGAFLGHPVVGLARASGLDRLGVFVYRHGTRLTHPWIHRLMPEVISGSRGDDAAEFLARTVHSMNEAARRYEAAGLVHFEAYLRYEDLESSPVDFARALADGIGVDPSPALDTAFGALGDVISVDAQEGSTMKSRKSRSLSAEDAIRIERITGRTETRGIGSTEVAA